MSDKEKKLASDSGVELSRKSRSGSGSFGGVDKSSFDDFDSGRASRRGTYDDYDDDDDYADDAKVDLNAFLGEVPDGDDVGDEDEEEEEDSEEEDEDEEEDDGEYETEEEEVELGPSDEIPAYIETPSHQVLAEQREQNKRTLKQRKRVLINEYLHDVRHFSNLRVKNVLLGLKIMAHVEERQAVVQKYVQQEIDEQQRLKEAEKLQMLHRMESCAALSKGKKKRKKEKVPKVKKKKEKPVQKTRFSADKSAEQPNTNTQSSSTEPEIRTLLNRKFHIDATGAPDVSLKTLTKEFVYNTESLKDKTAEFPEFTPKEVCRRLKYIKERVGKKLRTFSFYRSLFYKDVARSKGKIKKGIDLSDLTIEKLRSKSSKFWGRASTTATSTATVADVSAKPSKARLTSARASMVAKELSLGIPLKRKFNVTKEALSLARSKSRMALDHHKQEQKIKLAQDKNLYKDLHHFKFEFADPRLTAKQASVKLRDELIRMLNSRHVPTTQLRWPLEVKGVEFEERNPFGRVSLQYTRLSHHERELPHVAYKILLTNMAFLRTKEQRMLKEHRKNMVQLEEECALLKCGLQEIFAEIVEGLRIFSSLCGITDTEKKEIRHVAEAFIQELQKFYDEFLMTMLVKLYKCISSCEFALRRLWISEGKGEGAELHEFKDIMRCREKLKAEHKTVEKNITQYQRHSTRVLRTVRSSGKRLRSAKTNIAKMDSELVRLRRAVGVMIDGLYHYQETVKKHEHAEIILKSEVGILSSPVLTEDYDRLQVQIEDTKIKRLELQRKYNGKVREMEKIMPPPSRFVRYRLRS